MYQVVLCTDNRNYMTHCLTLSLHKAQFHLNFCVRHFHQFQNLMKADREKSQKIFLLTILLVLWFSQCNKFRKALVLIPWHGSIATTLDSVIKIKMLIQVFLHGLVPHKSHTTDGTVVLYAFINFCLRQDIESKERSVKRGNLLLKGIEVIKRGKLSGYLAVASCLGMVVLKN